MAGRGRRQTSADGVLCLRWDLIAAFFRGVLRTRLTAAHYSRTVLAYAKPFLNVVINYVKQSCGSIYAENLFRQEMIPSLTK